MTMEKSRPSVCVTGGSGWIGSTLVYKLLSRGYIVHTTLRNLGDSKKVEFLKSFPNADTKLHLFEADIYKPQEFERAIEGCDFVFHVASPMTGSEGSDHKDMINSTVAAAKSIAMSCIKLGTVKRLIYTSSVMAASPLKVDGSGYNDYFDETCWTPLDFTATYTKEFLMAYATAKTLAEKEMLNINGDDSASGLEVVTLACGLVGGHTLLPSSPSTVLIFVSQLLDNAELYYLLKYMEEFLGKVPVVHIEDVCEAHIFSLETNSMKGRYLCASSYIAAAEIAKYYQRTCPDFHVKEKYLGDDPKRDIDFRSTKLLEKGFTYKYDAEMILDDCIKCAKKMGFLK